MDKLNSQLTWRRYLTRVKPWVAVALVIAVVLIGFYLVLGMRYRHDSQQAASANNQLGRISGQLRQKALNIEALETGLKSQEQQLNEAIQTFNHRQPEDLVYILTTTAKETGIFLPKVTLGELGTETKSNVQYQVQSIAVIVQGTTPNIYRFLSVLQDKVAVAKVSTVTLSGLEGSPMAQVQLALYLSPETIQEDKKVR